MPRGTRESVQKTPAQTCSGKVRHHTDGKVSPASASTSGETDMNDGRGPSAAVGLRWLLIFTLCSANEDFKQEDQKEKFFSSFRIWKKKQKTLKAVYYSPRAPDNDSAAAWLCIVAAALAARRHWCRTTASVWETELPFRLSQSKHSREKWQEASWAFWFRRHQNNERERKKVRKSQGPIRNAQAWWHTSLLRSLNCAFIEAGTRISTAILLINNKHFFIWVMTAGEHELDARP